ncbi:helix-turn-helix transcriptional regulator [Carnobacterium maltaromaticum]|nr:helix-turn-helix transcriptional regulator [Carnobacterium maltaromaticum]
MEFSAQIKKIRTDNQLTQEQLAQQLNVSRQTISSWENNRNIPDLEMVVSIAKLFNISLDQLILGDDIMREKLVKDSS